ncbi:uncharacterized protein LOC131952670 [Physella acuta]|uniref:uncharacterized protein LOC131952670 n=1 Tax=Physella acuta TaxID=109671 RepID=UPI0027DAD8B2|nr:uncharacterized protein LOC131952670 [Physella acuta]
MSTMFRSLCITVLVLLAMTSAQNSTADGGQQEPISEGEVELVESKDNEFDQGLFSRVDRPTELPSQDRVASLYNEQYKAGTIATVEEPTSGCQGDTARTGSEVTQLAEVNLYVQYLLYQDWYMDYKK